MSETSLVSGAVGGVRNPCLRAVQAEPEHYSHRNAAHSFLAGIKLNSFIPVYSGQEYIDHFRGDL